MAKTLEDLKAAFAAREDDPFTLEAFKGWLAGKAGQWINQQSHVDREQAIEKAHKLAKLLITEEMFELCTHEGKMIPEMADIFADQMFQLLAWHYQFRDPENLEHSYLTRNILQIS